MRVKPQNVAKPNFVVFEGVNGAGKSSTIEALKNRIRRPLCVTGEPGGSLLGKELRSILLNPKFSRDIITELLLFAADRAEHVASVIKPAINRGELVLCDRFTFSTVAFQGYGSGASLSLIQQLNDIACIGIKPDLVVLFDIDVTAGLKRNNAAKKQDDHFELLDIAFHERVRKGFLAQADNSDLPWLVIDAARTKEEILSELSPIIL